MTAVLEMECITYQYKVCNAYFVFTDIMYNISKYKYHFYLPDVLFILRKQRFKVIEKYISSSWNTVLQCKPFLLLCICLLETANGS